MIDQCRKGDSNETLRFLRWFRPGGPWVLTAIGVDRQGIKTATFDEDSVMGMIDWLDRHNGIDNCYFMVNPARGPLTKKAAKEDVQALAWLHVDCDPPKGVDAEKAQPEIRGRLEAFEPKPTCLIFSGGGLQAFWRLDEPMYVGGNVQAAEELEAYNQQLELVLKGDHCHNIDRIMRLPGTWNLPNAKKRAAGRKPALACVVGDLGDTPVSLSSFTAAPRSSSSPSASLSAPPVKISGNLAPVMIDDLPEAVPNRIKMLIVQGSDPDDPTKYASRSEASWAVTCGLLRAGCDDDTVASILLDSDYAISGHTLAQKRPVEYVERQIQRAKQEVEADSQKFETDDDGRPYANQRNIRLAVSKLGLSVRFDSFSGRCLVDGLDGFGTYLDDAAVIRMWLLIDERFHFKASKDFFWSVVEDMARRNSCHVVCDYLSNLVWDKVPRLDGWMARYLGAPENEYTKLVGSIMLVAAVRRVRQPGCKFDEMVILESPQGQAKSTALAILAVREEWFSDDLPLGSDSKVVIERTQGRWIVEAAELAGMSKRDVEHLKGSLSRRIDRARPAYGRLTQEVPRQFIPIGTTNSDKYLRDSTGNRRFWPVRVGEIDLDALRCDVDQLWAEAALREAEGVSIRMDRSLWEIAAAEQAARQQWDPYQMTLYETLGEVRGKIKASDVWKIIGKPVERRTQADQQRVGEAMKALGFEHRQARFGGRPVYAYVRGEGVERREQIAVKIEDGNWVVFVDSPAVQQLDLPSGADTPDSYAEPY